MPKAATAKSPTTSANPGYCAVSEIELMVPLLYNKHPDERDTGKKKTEEQYENEGRLKIHVNNGSIIIPAWNLKVALIAGCQRTFKGKHSMTDVIKAFVFPKDAEWGIKEADCLHVCWGRVPPRTGSMQKIYRPQLNAGRKLSVRFEVVNKQVDFDKLREGWEQTGFMVGLGAWRPEYGRFRVLSFEKE